MDFNSDVEERFIKINDISLHVILVGPEDADPLILLHGFPDFWYGWKNILEGLKDDFRLIVPDLKGFNLSDKPEQVNDYDLKILVEDIKNLSEKLGLHKFNLVGHDWGGLISWAFAEVNPHLLNKLIIINAPHYKIFRQKIKDNKKQRKASGYISQLIKEGSDELLKQNNFQMLRFSVFENARNKSAFSKEDKAMYLQAWSQPKVLETSVNYYRANRRYDDWTGKIEVPTLVIIGMKDSYIKPIVYEGLSEFVSDLKVIKSKDSSHWIMHDDPDLVVSSIRDFIRK
ncbi:MAG: alpha/beta fold hydrolase [Promethearchaeati archaeon]